jgi:ribosomal protein L37AE/L43A
MRTDSPICPTCKRKCSPAGGNYIGTEKATRIWACFRCATTVEDTHYEDDDKNTADLISQVSTGHKKY